jgi:hypothetical protein
VGESPVVLKKKGRFSGKGRFDAVPIDRVGKIDVEIRDHRLALQGHIRRRGKVGLLDVLHLADESLLGRAP